MAAPPPARPPRGGATPPILAHHLRHNQVLHERVVILTVQVEEVPQVPAAERAEVEDAGNGFFRIVLRYGFMEEPNVPRDLAPVPWRGSPEGRGHQYARFVARTLVPAIDARYRTRCLIVLRADEGWGPVRTAAALDCSRSHVDRTLKRFEEAGGRSGPKLVFEGA